MTILEQRLTLITLGVSDLQAAKAFYTGVLGWKPEDDDPNIVFFDLGGYKLALYPHQGLAEDMRLAAEMLPAYRGFSLAYCARSQAEVDAIFAQLKAAGATILKNPEKVFWGGYSGYFADPEGHPWEVAYNPFWTIEASGRIAPK